SAVTHCSNMLSYSSIEMFSLESKSSESFQRAFKPEAKFFKKPSSFLGAEQPLQMRTRQMREQKADRNARDFFMFYASFFVCCSIGIIHSRTDSVCSTRGTTGMGR